MKQKMGAYTLQKARNGKIQCVMVKNIYFHPKMILHRSHGCNQEGKHTVATLHSDESCMAVG
jgi:hypothetical protein